MQAGGCIGSIPRGGCTVNAALTFDSLATFYVASACVYPVYGCTLAGYGNYDPAATADDGSCPDSGVSECTDSISLCYNPNATVRPSAAAAHALVVAWRQPRVLEQATPCIRGGTPMH